MTKFVFIVFKKHETLTALDQSIMRSQFHVVRAGYAFVD